MARLATPLESEVEVHQCENLLSKCFCLVLCPLQSLPQEKSVIVEFSVVTKKLFGYL